MYPEDKKLPGGKLRLFFEVNPMALLIERAGGKAVSQGKNPLDIVSDEISQKVPIVLGSKNLVEKYLQFKENR